jgi:hypothetical protein
VHGALLAVVHPDNTPHGANLTFAVPVLFFVIVTAALFLRFRSRHPVPGHVALKSSRWVTAGQSGKAAFGGDTVHASIDPAAAADSTGTQGGAPGTVQSGTAPPAAQGQGDQSASEQVKPADEGTEDDE